MRSILFCLAIASSWQPTAAAETLTPERAVKYLRIGDLRYSPDGSVALVAVSGVNGVTPQGHLWLADPGKKELRQFTFSQKTERSPEWAPQGDRVAFLSNRSGPMQVYVIPRTGGEARRTEFQDLGSRMTSSRFSAATPSDSNAARTDCRSAADRC
jgi:Tol biopolymer transport system component